MTLGVARATEEQEETLGDKFKRLFVRPIPTPKHRRKKKTTLTPTVSPSAANETPNPSPSETPASSAEPSATVSEAAETTPSATVETKTASPTPKSGTQYFEAVRPITPHKRGRRTQTPRPRQTEATAVPTMTPPTETPAEMPAERPMPSLPPVIAPATSASSAPPSKTSSPSPIAKKIETPKPVVPIDQIAESSNYLPEVGKIVDLVLELTTKNLGYKYVSADPKNGGMDSSGFIYYVLTQSGTKGVPRDAREQYIWVRKAGNFKAVLAQRDDSFELDELKPGDLLFWATNFGVSRDPEITQTMIYVGHEKATNQRLMIGASERSAYKGKSKSGVAIFDFKVGRATPKPNQERGPVFVGYGRIPGLGGK